MTVVTRGIDVQLMGRTFLDCGIGEEGEGIVGCVAASSHAVLVVLVED